MKTIYKVKYWMLVSCFFFLNCGSDNSSSSHQSYSDNFSTAVFVGKLYVLSCPSLKVDNSAFYNLVDDIDYLLEEDGDVIQCMRKLGKLMVAQGTQNFNFTNDAQNSVRENVMGMAGRAGLEAEAGDIADNVVSGMRNEQLQPIIIGQELIWLSYVLPDAAKGDWDGYENTGSIFRKQAQEQIAIIVNIIEQYGKYDPEILKAMGHVLPAVDSWSRQYGLGYIIGCGISLGVFK